MPTLPTVPGAFSANAVVLNHPLMRSPRDPEVYDGVPIRSAVSRPCPLKDRLFPLRTVNGNPLCTWRMPVISQPPSACFSAREDPNCGRRHTPEVDQTCVASRLRIP